MLDYKNQLIDLLNDKIRWWEREWNKMRLENNRLKKELKALKKELTANEKE